MKKLILAAALVAMGATCASAEENYAPEKGQFAFELQFNPFSDNFETFKIERLQGSYMLTDKDAIRFGLGLSVNSDKDTPSEENTDYWTNAKHGSFSINLGYERHFYNYKRIDLYAGAELVYTHRWASSKIQTDGTYTNNNGTEVPFIATDETINYDGKGNTAGNDVRFNIFTGINFSVYKGLYVGAELGLGIGANIDSWQKQKNEAYDYSEQKVVTNESKFGSNKKSSFNMEFKAQPALRLGWKF